MFFVIDKDKIVSYIISVGMVCILMIGSVIISKKDENLVKTSANGVLKENNTIVNNTTTNNIMNNTIKNKATE